MQGGGRSKRTTSGRINGVTKGSIWESRMKFDEVKGGIKVFNGEENSVVVGAEQKKKENSVGVSGNGGDQSGSRLQIYRRLKRNQSGGEIEKNRKTLKSEPVEGIERNPIQLRKTRSDGIEKNPIQNIRKTRSEETRNSKDIGVIKDKMISSSLRNVGQIRIKEPVVDYDHDDGVDADVEDEGEEDEIEDLVEEREIEIENTNYDVKEVNIDEQKPKRMEVEENKNQTSLELAIIPISSNVSKRSAQVKDHLVIDQDLKNPPSKKSFAMKEVNIEEQKPKTVVLEEKKHNQIHKPPIPISSRVSKQQPAAINHPVTDPNYTKLPPAPSSGSGSDEFQRFPESHSKLENFVDLVMWRDVSKSALVFGFGTFVLLSSSFTKDINFSLISAISYMGLVYLAAIFLYRSIIFKGAIDFEDSNQNLVLGEEEAIWLLEMILPYLNEFLLKLRSLFSGDPATTMKLAVLLFILARCGSSITIWKVAKLGFFGVFTLPKICSSYSTQLTGYGKFWIRRFQDAWDSCSHKKAVAIAGFTLVWNFSSIVARIWAVFMLIVAVRYYQQSILLNEPWGGEVDGDDSYQRQDGSGHTTTVEFVKEKKIW